MNLDDHRRWHPGDLLERRCRRDQRPNGQRSRKQRRANRHKLRCALRDATFKDPFDDPPSPRHERMGTRLSARGPDRGDAVIRGFFWSCVGLPWEEVQRRLQARLPRTPGLRALLDIDRSLCRCAPEVCPYQGGRPWGYRCGGAFFIDPDTGTLQPMRLHSQPDPWTRRRARRHQHHRARKLRRRAARQARLDARHPTPPTDAP